MLSQASGSIQREKWFSQYLEIMRVCSNFGWQEQPSYVSIGRCRPSESLIDFLKLVVCKEFVMIDVPGKCKDMCFELRCAYLFVFVQCCHAWWYENAPRHGASCQGMLRFVGFALFDFGSWTRTWGVFRCFLLLARSCKHLQTFWNCGQAPCKSTNSCLVIVAKPAPTRIMMIIIISPCLHILHLIAIIVTAIVLFVAALLVLVVAICYNHGHVDPRWSSSSLSLQVPARNHTRHISTLYDSVSLCLVKSLLLGFQCCAHPSLQAIQLIPKPRRFKECIGSIFYSIFSLIILVAGYSCTSSASELFRMRMRTSLSPRSNVTDRQSKFPTWERHCASDRVREEMIQSNG